MTPQACGASLPDILDAGWKCTGRGLIVVYVLPRINLPVVLPARALDVIEPEPWWDLPVERFTGGDHAHLVVPRRPPPFEGDTPVIIGDAVQSWRYVGQVDGKGQLWQWQGGTSS